MPTARHPRKDGTDGYPPAAVDVNGQRRAIDREDGTFEYDDESWLQRFADRHGVDPDDIREDGDDLPAEVAELLDGTVDEISDAIAAGEFDDRLDAIEQREQNTAERTTVAEAVENRRDALEDED